jgi:hypothetical protein
MSSRGVYCDMVCHSYEGRNPESSLVAGQDTRLDGHDEKNTPIPQVDSIKKFCTVFAAYYFG